MKSPTLSSHSDESLNRAIAISIMFHLALLAAFTLRMVFYPSEPLNLDDAIHVDIVALPDKIVTPPELLEPPPQAPPPVSEPAPPPKPEAKPEPVVEAKPAPAPKPVAPEPPKISLSKTKQDQAAALKRLEAMQRLEQMVKDEKRAPIPKNPQPVVVKGNVVSPGSSLTGIARFEHNGYLRLIKQKVTSQWALPQWLANAKISATVRIFIDAQGNVVKKTMIRSSQNEVFDERTMVAIEQASPLPPPPDSLVNMVAVDGIAVELSPKASE